MFKPALTQKINLVHSPSKHQNPLTSQSSPIISEQPSRLAKIATLFSNRWSHTSAVIIGLTVSIGLASLPANYLEAVAAELAANSTDSIDPSARQPNSTEQYVAQLRNDVSVMQARHHQQPSVLIAQSIPTRFVPLSVANRTNTNSLQFSGEVAVPIEVAAPKSKTFKPVATAQPYATGAEGYLENPIDNLPIDKNTETTIGFSWPAVGTLTSKFGRRWGRMHKGIDIAGPIGTPVNAAADGTVVVAGWSSGGYGNLVEVKHNDGTITRYGHNSRLSVSLGQTVRQGQQVAEMGSTGHSTGSHLHFEIRPSGGNAVNPIAHLPSNS